MSAFTGDRIDTNTHQFATDESNLALMPERSRPMYCSNEHSLDGSHKTLQWFDPGILLLNTGRGSRWTVWAVLAAVLLVLGPRTATAEIILHVQDAEVIAGESGFFDVFFEVTDGTPMLAGYQIELNLSDADAGIRFTDFGEAEDAVFPGQVAEQTFGRPTLPGPTAAANDFIWSGENPILDGAGLLRVFFEADLGSSGVQVTVDPDPLLTSLSDGLGTIVPIDGFVAGTITVVPEPSTLILCALGCICMFIYGCRRVLLKNVVTR